MIPRKIGKCRPRQFQQSQRVLHHGYEQDCGSDEGEEAISRQESGAQESRTQEVGTQEVGTQEGRTQEGRTQESFIRQALVAARSPPLDPQSISIPPRSPSKRYSKPCSGRNGWQGVKSTAVDARTKFPVSTA